METGKGIVFLWDEGAFACDCIGWQKGNTIGLRTVNKNNKTWYCRFCKKWNKLSQIIIDKPASIGGIAEEGTMNNEDQEEEDESIKYFKKWYSENESKFHCGNISVKEIAYSAFLEGYSLCGN